MATVGDLFVTLGFNVDDSKLQAFDAKIKELRNGLVTLTAEAAGTLYALDKIASGSAQSANSLRQFTLQTGLSSDELQKWQAALVEMDISKGFDDATASLTTFQLNLSKMQLLGLSSSAQWLGIDSHMTAFQAMEKIRSEYHSINPAILTNFLGELGVNPGFKRALAMDKGQFDKQFGSQVDSAETVKANQELADSYGELTVKFKLWKDSFTAAIGPSLQKAMGWFKDLGDWLARVGAHIPSLGALGTKLGAIAIILLAVVAALGSAALLLGGFIISMGKLSVAFLAFGRVAAGAFAAVGLELLPLTVAIAALLLVLDDVATYERGGKSVIGELMNLKKPAWLQRVDDWTKKGAAAKDMANPENGATTGQVLWGHFVNAGRKAVGSKPLGADDDQGSVTLPQKDTGNINDRLKKKSPGILAPQIDPADLELQNAIDAHEKRAKEINLKYPATGPSNTTNHITIDGAKSPEATARAVIYALNDFNNGSYV
jgi:hypothetical protein